MKKIKHICFIVPGYPVEGEPVFTFVRQLISEVSNLGIECTVISPTSITNSFIRKTKKRKFHWQDITNKGNIINVYQPKIFTFSNLKLFSNSVSSIIRWYSISRTYKKINITPDALYGHFWDDGLIAAKLGYENNIPAFVATGESEIVVHKRFSDKIISKYKEHISGVIAVSSKNKNESIELNLADENNIKVIPNAIDSNVFYKTDKIKARNILGFDEDYFIIAFVGGFIHRKGVLRLSEALKGLSDVKVIYIGEGVLKPSEKNALHIGKLSHKDIPLYLNAADIFVLPTLAEGASNAIIEAMACGLPIISSNGSFNDDILSPKNSIRIDSMDINEIREAIVLLRDDRELKKRMSKASMELAESFKIEDRAKKIMNFMKEKSFK